MLPSCYNNSITVRQNLIKTAIVVVYIKVHFLWLILTHELLFARQTSMISNLIRRGSVSTQNLYDQHFHNCYYSGEIIVLIHTVVRALEENDLLTASIIINFDSSLITSQTARMFFLWRWSCFFDFLLVLPWTLYAKQTHASLTVVDCAVNLRKKSVALTPLRARNCMIIRCPTEGSTCTFDTERYWP